MPLVSYYGGKQRIASKIATIIKTIPHTVYSEPFVGGGAVLYKLFDKGRPNITNNGYYREAINDKNELITNLYRVARDSPDELQRRLELTLYSQAEHKKAVEICKNGCEDTIELAWAVYVNLNQSFANKLNRGWGTGVKSDNHSASWSNRIKSLPQNLSRLKEVAIGCEDAIRFIDRWDSPQTLHYCDPPYPNTNQGHYSGYSIDDFKTLVDKLSNCQGSFVLSNYSQDFIAPSDWQKIEIETRCSASGKGKTRSEGLDRNDKFANQNQGDRKRTEVLWFCDRSENIRHDLIDIAKKNTTLDWNTLDFTTPHSVK